MKQLTILGAAAVVLLLFLFLPFSVAQVPIPGTPFIPDASITAAKLLWTDIVITPRVTSTSGPGYVAANSHATRRDAGLSVEWNSPIARQWFMGTGSPVNTNTCWSLTEYTDGVFNGVRQMWCKGGNVLIGTTTDDGVNQLQVAGTALLGRLKVASVTAPSSASDTGVAGEIRWDASFVYMCVSANTWKRTAISTW